MATITHGLKKEQHLQYKFTFYVLLPGLNLLSNFVQQNSDLIH